MNSASCQRCDKVMPQEGAYCPNCGTRAPASFVLGSPGNDTGAELFAKPEPETALSWGPMIVGLAALFAIVAVVIAVNGTGGDIALAPTPAPPTPSATPPTPSATAPTPSATPSRPAWSDDARRVRAGSDAKDYLAVFLDLAREYDLGGTLVFAAADEATRLDLRTGVVTQIPLDGRDYLLGARSGIISGTPGRTIVAHRWDTPTTPIEVTAGYADFVGISWVDANGWELVPYTASGESSIAAVWDTGSADSPNVPTKKQPGDFVHGPVELGTPFPQRWTWDDGAEPLRWQKVLAADNGRLLVRDCEAPGECAHLVVDDHDDVVVAVDESFPGHELDDPRVVLSSGTLALWTDAGIGADMPKAAEIIDLESGARTRLPDLDRYLHVDAGMWPFDAFWIDDALIALAYLSEEGETHVLVDRGGQAVAELSWSSPSHVGSLRYFAPDHHPRTSR